MDDELKAYIDNSSKDRMCTMLEMLIRMQFPNVKSVIVEPEVDSFNISVSGDANLSQKEVEEYLQWMKKEFEIKPKDNDTNQR